MSIFDDDEDFELATGSDETPKRPKQAPPNRAQRPPNTNANSQLGRRPVTPRPETRNVPQVPKRTVPSVPIRTAPTLPSPPVKSGLPPKPIVNRKPVPEPTPQQPEPVYVPEQIYVPEPVYQTPEPVRQPEPDYYQPEPVRQPEPDYYQPEPVRQPEPVYQHPEPTYVPEQVLPPAVVDYREDFYPSHMGMTEVHPPRDTFSQPDSYPNNYSQHVDPRALPESVNHSYRSEELSNRSDTGRSVTRRPDVAQYDDGDFEKKRPSGNRSAGRNTKNSKNEKSATIRKRNSKRKNSKGDDDEETPVSRFTGPRRKVLIINTCFVVVVLSILGFGIKSIVAPPYIPSKTDVEGLVSNQLNLTAFDKDGGRAFVNAFSKEYFTIDESASVQKRDRLKAFTTDTIAGTIMSSTNVASGAKQSIVGEPVIAKITAKDDSNAVYSVGVKIGNKWIYSDVPVFYDSRTLSYAISGVPTFTPPPTVATPGLQLEAELSQDIEVVAETQPNIESFFKAWASSDQESLGRYVTGTADAETRAGLQNTVYFSELRKYTVEGKAEEDPTNRTRKALAEVSWSNAPKNASMSYNQTFELELYKQPDNRWYVADITPVKNIYKPSTETEKQ